MYCAKFFKSEKVIRSSDLVQVVEDVKHYLIESGIEWDICSVYNEDTGKLIDRMEFQRDMFSNECRFKMRGQF